MHKTARQLNREIAEALSGGRPHRSSRPAATNGSRRRGSSARHHVAVKKETTSDKRDIDQLAKLFGLPEWDDVDERNTDYYWESARGIEDEDERQQAADAARDELYGNWYDAVERVSSNLFEQHGLELQPAGKWHPSTRHKTRAEARPHSLKIVPSKSWDDAANKIRETVNGVGYFHFDSLREFLDSGPYTARQAVLSHLGAIADYPEVYGDRSARSMYDAAMR